MWLTPGRASGRKNVAPKLFMMAKLKGGYCTARCTVLAVQQAMVKDKNGEGARLQSNYIQLMMVCNLMYCSDVGHVGSVQESESCYMEYEQYDMSI